MPILGAPEHWRPPPTFKGPTALRRDAGLLFLPDHQHHHPFKPAWAVPTSLPHQKLSGSETDPTSMFAIAQKTHFKSSRECSPFYLYLQNQQRGAQIFVERMKDLE